MPAMKRLSLLAAAVVAGAVAFDAAALSNCKYVTDRPAAPGDWTLSPKDVAALHDVYTRITKVARIKPALVLCESRTVNAAAMAGQGRSAILVTAELVRVTRDDPDQLAAVIGHEFGHLIHKHAQKKLINAVASIKEAAQQREATVHAGATVAEANAEAYEQFLANTSAFSRTAEREADDQGFSLANLAGYSPSGARRFAEKMNDRTVARETSYLSSHPGWQERMQRNKTLEANEEFRAEAAGRVAVEDVAGLRKVLVRWNREIPGSGAASYYEAMHLHLSGAPQDKVAAKFDEAAGYFVGEGKLPHAGQSYQAESDMARLALCVSLFRADRRYEALQCAATLRTQQDVDLFRKITKADVIWMPQADRHLTIFADRVRPAEVMITNCEHVAEREALRRIYAWRVTRTVDPKSRNGGYAAMECSPNMCNCVAIPEAEIPQSAIDALSENR